MTQHVISEMRRELAQLKRLAAAGELTHERFMFLHDRLVEHIDDVERFMEPVWFGVDWAAGHAPARAIDGGPPFRVSDDDRRQLLGLPICRARYVGHLAVIEGGRR